MDSSVGSMESGKAVRWEVCEEADRVYNLTLGDCREVMKNIPDSSVDLVLTDPPYFRVKGEAWDRQWDTKAQFLLWLESISVEWYRILKPNGSLYCFASPYLSAYVEVLLGNRFNVLNNIRWDKTSERGCHGHSCKETLRRFFPAYESIIFCDKDEQQSLEPLRSHVVTELRDAGISANDINLATNSQMANHYLNTSQWTFPTEEKYNQLKAYVNRNRVPGLREYLPRKYCDLKKEYEQLRRPFTVSSEVQFTDTWHFKIVNNGPLRHPCEKPVEMLKYIINASTRKGAVVLDSFMGTGSVGVACAELGRAFIGIEQEPKYFERAHARIRQQ